VFQSGIAVNAPLGLSGFVAAPPKNATSGTSTDHVIPTPLIDHPDADWDRLSVLAHPDALTNPVLLLVDPARDPSNATARLRTALQTHGRSAEYMELDPDFASGVVASRARVYRRIGEFLNVQLRDGNATAPTAEGSDEIANTARAAIQ
jgi:hypothetical protein